VRMGSNTMLPMQSPIAGGGGEAGRCILQNAEFQRGVLCGIFVAETACAIGCNLRN